KATPRAQRQDILRFGCVTRHAGMCPRASWRPFRSEASPIGIVESMPKCPLGVTSLAPSFQLGRNDRNSPILGRKKAPQTAVPVLDLTHIQSAAASTKAAS